MILAVLVSLFCTSSHAGAESPNSLLVFAAASVTDVMDTIGRLYASETGQDVVFSFAGSSTLARQIEHGAPADVFVSANADWMTFLRDRDLLADGEPTVFATNRLVAIAPSESDLEIRLAEGYPIAEAFSGRLAIADPGHVPAGMYAKSALMALGWWDDLKARLAIGHSVRGALAYVDKGACDLGIVYATDAAISKRVRVVATFPDTLHDPILYVAGVVERPESRAAGAFLEFLVGEQAQEHLLKSGFHAVIDGENVAR